MKRIERLRAKLRSAREKWNESYEKRLCNFITRNAVLWVWCSYILAWFGRYEIAQSLSQEAVRTILGVVIAYSVKALSENISKYGYKGKQGPETAAQQSDGYSAGQGGREPGE